MTVKYIADLPGQRLRVLDLCCGTARVASDMLALSNVCEVVALDISEAAIEQAKCYLANSRYRSKLRFVAADIMSPEFTNELVGTFDVIVCLDALHHLSQPSEALNKVAGILNRRGTLIGNFLVAEGLRAHVVAKKGRFRYFRDFCIAEILRMFSFYSPVWEWAGRMGRIRFNLLSADDVRRLLNQHFTIQASSSTNYLWFTATKRSLPH